MDYKRLVRVADSEGYQFPSVDESGVVGLSEDQLKDFILFVTEFLYEDEGAVNELRKSWRMVEKDHLWKCTDALAEYLSDWLEEWKDEHDLTDDVYMDDPDSFFAYIPNKREAKALLKQHGDYNSRFYADDQIKDSAEGNRFYLPINGRDLVDDWVYDELCEDYYEVDTPGKSHLVKFTRGGQRYTIEWHFGGIQFIIKPMDGSNWEPIDEYFDDVASQLEDIHLDIQKSPDQYIVRYYTIDE